ncbi:hypothetical protein OO010_12575 [Flavobacteriaceae bacterium KMM 6898]|nr:hypothetical protein [Flavobacteriaceae bacterium KMM 6898]
MRLIVIIILLITSCTTSSKFQTKTQTIRIPSKFQIENLQTELLEMIKLDQLYRQQIVELKENASKVDSSLIDSLLSQQKTMDTLNTVKLLEISKRFGFPNTTRFKGIPAFLIFQHSPTQYFPEINELIEREYNAERLPPMEYEMIKWHLNGRQGTPFKISIDQ